MKTRQVIKLTSRSNVLTINIEVCYALNDKGNVILDEESMTEVFETGIRMLNDVLEG